jgi:hypothetical protein
VPSVAEGSVRIRKSRNIRQLFVRAPAKPQPPLEPGANLAQLLIFAADAPDKLSSVFPRRTHDRLV